MSGRPLDTTKLVERFLTDVLGLPRSRKTTDLAQKIAKHEIVIGKQLAEDTLETGTHRVEQAATPAERKQLREQVIRELFERVRPQSDSRITVGRGGSKPRTKVRFDRKAVIVIGPPASGKSRIANKIADAFGAYVLDADHAKRKLPEFQDGESAALVHEESDAMVFGNGRTGITCLLERVVEEGANLVIPKVGANTEKIRRLNEELRSNRYRVSLVLANADKTTAVCRALERFRRTGRYVPLAYVYDEVGHEPHLTYLRLRVREERTKKWESFAAYDSETEPPTLICRTKKWPRKIFAKVGAA